MFDIGQGPQQTRVAVFAYDRFVQLGVRLDAAANLTQLGSLISSNVEFDYGMGQGLHTAISILDSPRFIEARDGVAKIGVVITAVQDKDDWNFDFVPQPAYEAQNRNWFFFVIAINRPKAEVFNMFNEPQSLFILGNGTRLNDIKLDLVDKICAGNYAMFNSLS